jgi:galactoside O-acetyltransferase
VGEHSRIDSFVKLEGGEGLTIGRHVHIASFCHIGIGGGTTILEDGTAFASGAKVLSGSNIPDAPSVSAVSPLGRAQKYTTIVRKNAAVYAGAIILPGVTLGEGCRIAAGAVVTKDVPAFETWGGIPARKLAGAKAVERC